MAFSYGFYDSFNGDRKYYSPQISMIFDGLIRDGVYATVGDSLVLKTSPVQNTIIVGSGRAWFDHTWNYNDADLPITCPPSEILLDRIDAIVLDINGEISSRTNDIICVSGTPSSNPQPPSLISEKQHHQYPLGYIRRNANDTIIEASKITNTIGTDACPFVTGLLQVVSIEALLLQWRAQWEEWYKRYTEGYAGDFESWSTAQKESNTAWYEEQKQEMNSWEAHFREDYLNWLDDIKGTLSEDAATKLYDITDQLKHQKNKVKYCYGKDDAAEDSNGYYKIASINTDQEGRTFGIHLSTYSSNYLNYGAAPLDFWIYFITQTASGPDSCNIVAFSDATNWFAYSASGIFIKYPSNKKTGECEIYWKRSGNYQKIFVEVLSEMERTGAPESKEYYKRNIWTIYPNVDTEPPQIIEEDDYIVARLDQALQKSASKYSENQITSSSIRTIKKVTSLPSDAAQHPEILYVVVAD